MHNRSQGKKVACLDLKLEKWSVPFDPLVRFPPFDLQCPINYMHERRPWASEPISVYVGKRKTSFRVVVTFEEKDINTVVDVKCDSKAGAFFGRQSYFTTEYEVTILLVDQNHNGQNHRHFQLNAGDSCDVGEIDYDCYVKDDKLIFCITGVKEIEKKVYYDDYDEYYR